MFTLFQAKTKIIAVTVVSELCGKERKHGCSIKFEMKTNNWILSEFESQLRHALYERDDETAAQLVLEHFAMEYARAALAHTAEQADAVRNEERYQWLRRRAVMVDYSDETATTLTLFKDEGPTGEFLDDWIDGQIAASSTGNPT